MRITDKLNQKNLFKVTDIMNRREYHLTLKMSILSVISLALTFEGG